MQLSTNPAVYCLFLTSKFQKKKKNLKSLSSPFSVPNKFFPLLFKLSYHNTIIPTPNIHNIFLRYKINNHYSFVSIQKRILFFFTKWRFLTYLRENHHHHRHHREPKRAYSLSRKPLHPSLPFLVIYLLMNLH